MIEVYAIRILPEQQFMEMKEELLILLPEEVRDTMQRYRMVNVMQRSLFGELMTRKILAVKLNSSGHHFRFQQSEKGKPYLQDNPYFFNISHSGDWVTAAFCGDSEVGIDVERIKKVNFEIAERFYSEKEKKKLFSLRGKKKLEYFFDLWTMKESYLKLLGKGLTKPLSSFTISGDNGRFHLSNDIDNIQEVYFRQFDIDKGYKLSVCSFKDDFENKIRVLNINDIFIK